MENRIFLSIICFLLVRAGVSIISSIDGRLQLTYAAARNKECEMTSAALRFDRLRCGVVVLIALGALLHAHFASAADHGEQIKLLVLDLELVGDLTDPALASAHEKRIRHVSDLLRQELAQLPAYEIVNSTPAKEHIERLRATQYLHKCNGCEIDVALELGAEQVLVAWVHRVSQLILSITYEIREVPSGRPVKRKAFDFRGDNDTGWSRAVSYMVKDLAQSQRRVPPAH
jgi:hypothetical protein